MRYFQRLTYANVMATLALFAGLSGTAVAGSQMLFTGADIKDESLTGKDIKPGSLVAGHFSRSALRTLRGNAGARGATGAKGEPGSQGVAGPQGVAGAQGTSGIGITTAATTGTDATDYQDMATLASLALTTTGDYVIFTTFTVDNTGTENAYLNCGYRFAGVINGAAGANPAAGETATTTSAGVLNAENAGTAEFLCVREGGNTTYNIRNIKMRAHYLG